MRPDHERDLRGTNHDLLLPEEQCDEDDDGLGYYEDGTKRTLTDEQIAMFKHSELEAVRRAQDRSSSRHVRINPLSEKNIADDTNDMEPGEILSESESRTPFNAATSKPKKKSRKAKGREQAEQPDLRKRTWDVVEHGLETLDYDDGTRVPPTALHTSQRRHIAYDDD